MTMLNLNWDLVIIVFFAIVMSAGFVIGRSQTAKIIISIYVAIIATQGIGNVIMRLSNGSAAAMQVIGSDLNLSLLSAVKIFLFALFTVILVIRNGIEVSAGNDGYSAVNIIYSTLYGFATAGLIASTVLAYAAGKGILDASLAASPTIMPIVSSSKMMLLMALNQDIWFTLPALLLIFAGLMNDG